MSRTPRQPLLEKISGPNAISVARLIERGDAAAARVHATFGVFLDQRIRELCVLRRRVADGPSGRQEFYAAVVDLRGSAATAARHAVAAIAASLEALLKERLFDSRAAVVLDSHLDALVLVAAGNQSERAIRLLAAELEQAVARLAPRQEAVPAEA